MSYHNGSVWPHDNALIALGFARYDLKDEAARVFNAMFSAANYQESRRLPELFCGFLRRRHRGPTAYPVACAPQAWASAAPLLVCRALLGLEPDVPDGRLALAPALPDGCRRLEVAGMQIAGHTIASGVEDGDMSIRGLPRGIAVTQPR